MERRYGELLTTASETPPEIKTTDYDYDYLRFYVPLKNFSLIYGDVTIAGEGLQNLGLCSALRPLSREGSLSCHTCCDTGPRFFRSHPKDGPI
jgi:hypothetical protein